MWIQVYISGSELETERIRTESYWLCAKKKSNFAFIRRDFEAKNTFVLHKAHHGQ
jgi:hypothetical protein